MTAPATDSKAARAEELRRRRRRWAIWISVLLIVLSVAALVVGYLMLTTWEATQATLECGSPLDNPGFEEGSPCHAAVNRQTAFGWTMVFVGVWLLVGGVLVAVFAKPKRPGQKKNKKKAESKKTKDSEDPEEPDGSEQTDSAEQPKSAESSKDPDS